jgi:hypothetical protein
MTPNRIAVYLTAIAALLGGLAPAVANLDLTSTIGIVAGLGTLLGVVYKWLEGWQKYEAELPVEITVPVDIEAPKL